MKRAYYARKTNRIIINNIFCFFMAILFVFLSGCTEKKPVAVLHNSNDEGYIPCILSSYGSGLEISAPQAFVYDVELDAFTFTKGSEYIIYPASKTKLLTILYALTILEPDFLVHPGDELSLVASDSSLAYIKKEHTLSVEMLIEGMLLPSGNDAAYVLAAAAGKKLSQESGDNENELNGITAVEIFIKGMNEYAKQIGLCGSNFKSPDGYHDKDHYTTIEDIAIISSMAYENELIKKYAALSEDNVIYSSGHTNHWVNTNLMLDKESYYYCEYVTGLKTGSTGKGNYNLICTVEYYNKTYIIGVFSAKNKNDRFDDMKMIIDRLMLYSA